MTRHLTDIVVGETYQLDGHKRRWRCSRILNSGEEALALFESRGDHELRLPVRKAMKRMELCRVYA